MTKFAEYGFNKSHTAAYAVVTYHTAWLKAYHCSAFMAATMSADLDNTDTIKIFYEDTVANGIKVLPPDVNASDYRFVPTDSKTIRYGLGAVKGVGEPAVRAILAARDKGGPFKDLFDFACRSTNASPTAGHRGPGARRRLRHHRPSQPAERHPARHRRPGHRGRRPDRRQRPAGRPLSTSPAKPRRRWPTTSGAPLGQRDKLRGRRSRSASSSGHPFNAFKDEVRRFVRRLSQWSRARISSPSPAW